MDLNPQQREAVEHPGGPLLIVAGAGSGKTRTLTARLAHLIARGVPPDEIVAITFTNKAAEEMRSRLTTNDQRQATNAHSGKGVAGRQSSVISPFIGTFHSFGARILRENARVFGRTAGYTIFDTDDSLAAMKAAMEAIGLSKDRHPPAMLLGLISKIKSELLDPADLLDARGQEALAAYEALLARSNAFDFDDLIEKVVALFEQDPAILACYQRRHAHLLVDEYQDVNTAQYRFVQLLAAGHRNLSVVGDDAQAIYGWRSADYRNFLNFEKDWPDARVVFLDQNYRSSGVIVAAASALIRHNKAQKPKRLWTENASGEVIRIVRAPDEDEEADWIADTIRNSVIGNSVIKKTPITQLPNYPITTAVLYRTNAQSRALEQALIVHDLPYRIFGGLKFYERKEVKDVVAGLRIAANPRDEVSRDRLIKALPVAAARRAVAALAGAGEGRTIPELIGIFLEESDYLGLLARKFRNAPERRENVEELITFAGTFTNLHEFLERVALLQSADAPANRKGQIARGKSQNEPRERLAIRDSRFAVNLMTIHLAKGLEFDRVYLAGAAEGLLPHARSLGSRGELEEERRLMYVAMTRARRHLAISFTRIPSRFLYELPPELVAFHDLAGERDELPNEEEAYLE